MFEIPLFPLNTVLFPGTPIQLNIFEPRYMQMVNDCMRDKSPFGVVLIRRGLEAFGPLAEPYRIGCTAHIVQLEKLADGRMNITAIGEERFRVLTYDPAAQPYLVGSIQPYPIENPDPVSSGLLAQGLRQRFQRFIQSLLSSGATQFNLNQLPEDGAALAFLAAAVLQIPPLQKQELLSMEYLDRLLERLDQHYIRELALLEVVLSDSEHLQVGGFSLN